MNKIKPTNKLFDNDSNYDKLFDDFENESYKFLNYLIPKMNYSEKIFLKDLYGINNWEDCRDYVKKYINIDNVFTIERIIKISWKVFGDSIIINLELIEEIFKIYIDKHFKSKKIKNVMDLIFTAKKNKNLKKGINLILEYLGKK